MRFVSTLLLACVSLSAFGATDTPNGLVILLTDYGSDSVYVGLIKGAIYASNPEAKVDSITNASPPFDIQAGAYLLEEGCVTFPKGTVFCVIVDPGVGTHRKPIVLATKNGYYFVGPDNGIMTLVARRFGIAEIRECTNDKLWRGDVSTTFHGRDIFGPVAGALSRGTALSNVGPRLDAMVVLDLPKSHIENGAVVGAVIRTDVYGNLVTNIRRDDLEALGIERGGRVDVVIGDDHFTAPYVGTYGDVPQGERLVLIQSAGFVELAANMSSLAESVKEGLNAKVTLAKAPAAP